MMPTKHAGTLFQFDPPIRYVVADYGTPDPCWAFFETVEPHLQILGPSNWLVELATQQLEKDST